MSTYNVPLFRKVIEAIENDPAHWSQLMWVRKWSEDTLPDLDDLDGMSVDQWTTLAEEIRQEQGELCGTTMCLAGWTCHINGDTFVPRSVSNDMYDVLPDGVGEPIRVLDRATQLLGLAANEAGDLFSAAGPTTPAELRADIERVIGEKL